MRDVEQKKLKHIIYYTEKSYYTHQDVIPLEFQYWDKIVFIYIKSTSLNSVLYWIRKISTTGCRMHG